MGLINQYFKSDAHFFKKTESGSFILLYRSQSEPTMVIHPDDPRDWYPYPIEPCTKYDFDSAANQLIDFLKGGEVA